MSNQNWQTSSKANKEKEGEDTNYQWMRQRISPQILQTSRIMKEFYKQLYTHKFENTDEMEQIL